MKKIVLVGVVALAVVGAMARDEIPMDVAEKIPEAYRQSVLSEIRAKAHRQVADELSEKFGIVYVDLSSRTVTTGWTNTCGRSILWTKESLPLGCPQKNRKFHKHDKDGRLVKIGKAEDFEEWRWRENRLKEILDALWKDQLVVDAAVSNVATTARKKVSQNTGPCVGLLEEPIPLEEAIELAKDGKGKGYFQLALRYANGLDLPQEPQTAYKMLRKAVAVDYANAILIEGLCDEEHLKPGVAEVAEVLEDVRNGVSGKNSAKATALCDYCGTHVRFDTGRWKGDRDPLTNEVAFARVMGKYEKAKALGAVTATNQIAALNKRLADFHQALAVKEKKEKEKAQWWAQRRVMWANDQANDMKVYAEVGAKERERYRVAFKKMFGYEMGETIAREAGDVITIDSLGRHGRVRKLRMPYRNFTSMHLYCIDDHLYAIELEAESQEVSNAMKSEVIAVVKDLEQRYGVDFDEEDPMRWVMRGRCGQRYGWTSRVMVNIESRQARRGKMYDQRGKISVYISDCDLRSRLRKAEKTNSSASAEKKSGDVDAARSNKKESDK